MKRKFGAVAVGCLAVALCALIQACGDDHDHMPHNGASPFEDVKKAVAVVHPTEGNSAMGVVEFTEEADGVRVKASIKGLTPNAMHGFHIHQFGDCTAADGTSAGGHYDPEMTGHHGLPDSGEDKHAGDLGNLSADENGEAVYSALIKGITIGGDESPILGRGVIVHAKPDDGGQPTGNAGARIGCGVIGVANTAN